MMGGKLLNLNLGHMTWPINATFPQLVGGLWDKGRMAKVQIIYVNVAIGNSYPYM
jgi:hypothetical protein